MDSEWRKPYTQLETLQGASTCLDDAVQKLQSSVNALTAAVQDYHRVREVAQFQVNYEILPEEDIRHAGSEVIGKRLPEIEALLTRAQAGLNALEKEVKSVEYKVDEQAERIKSLEPSLQPTQLSTRRPQKRQKTDPIRQLQKRKHALESELQVLEKHLDETKRKSDRIAAEQAAATEQKEAVSVDHADPSNDQTMTVEDAHTLKQIKALSKLLLSPEESAMVTQLLEKHCKE